MPTLLTPQEISELLLSLPGWFVDQNQLQKTFSFNNYHETMAFLNATAWISHRSDHHPDVTLGYNKITLKYTTHSVNGLTRADFFSAIKVETLFTF